MNILILSIKAGMGHHQTGNALKDEFEKMGDRCVMLDTLEYVSPILCETISRGYLLSTKFTKAYAQFYRMAEKKQSVDMNFLAKMLNKISSSKLMKFISSFKPDAIICTHIFSAQIVTDLKDKGKIDCLTMGIITDFTVHPFWEETRIDYYVTASELLDYQMEKKGIDSSKAVAAGIPIHPKFSHKIDRSSAAKILGIEDKTTVLVIMGSMGYGHMMKELIALDNMKEDFQILCVCGNNKRIYALANKYSWKKSVKVYGYVDNVDIMMDAASIIVTKPGGLTTSELLAKGMPAVLVNPIPGQEDRNVEFLLNNGLAVKASKTFTTDEAVYQLLKNPSRLKILSEAAAHAGKPNAAADICNFVKNKVANKEKI